jgi:hypothetical protein
VLKKSNPLKHPLVKQSSYNPHHLTKKQNTTHERDSRPHLLSASVTPAARRAASGKTAAVMTADEKT